MVEAGEVERGKGTESGVRVKQAGSLHMRIVVMVDMEGSTGICKREQTVRAAYGLSFESACLNGGSPLLQVGLQVIALTE